MSILELPEIETLRRDLERETATRKIKSAEAVGLKSFPDIKQKKDFGEHLVGAKVVNAERRGLHLLLHLDNEYTIVIQLGEHGRLERVATREKPADDIVAVITFTQGGDLRIGDRKGSSSIRIVHDDDLADVLPTAEETGLDLLEHPLSWVDFGRMMKARKTPLKLLLTDPEVFVGIGDIYSNEILFDAGLRHDRLGTELSTQEIRRLYRSVVGIMHDAIKYRGTSLEERPFVDLTGTPGEFADHLAVYGKAGQLSPRSREPIQKTSFKHQVVFYCNTQV
ncbi:MAG: DNA-formamidopyrimidine glycosylase family protein [Acidimicrobiales bacterium]